MFSKLRNFCPVAMAGHLFWKKNLLFKMISIVTISLDFSKRSPWQLILGGEYKK